MGWLIVRMPGVLGTMLLILTPASAAASRALASAAASATGLLVAALLVAAASLLAVAGLFLEDLLRCGLFFPLAFLHQRFFIGGGPLFDIFVFADFDGGGRRSDFPAIGRCKQFLLALLDRIL